jgi:hypothetical protein
MHRSGTSCLAGILEASGAHLGEVATRSPHNLRGNRELESVWRLNDDVLRGSGGCWKDPPTNVTYTDQHRSRRDQILRDLQVSRPRVACIKDPRLLLMLGFWEESLPNESTRIVATVRDPARVALSLAARDGICYTDGLRLWRDYNERLLALGAERVTAIIDFSLSDMQYLSQAEALVRSVGLNWSTEAHDFYDGSLVKPEGAKVDVPNDDLELYECLLRMHTPTVTS